MWTRTGTFQTLIHIILEQQVSLASARAALIKLKEKTRTITPLKILALSDEEMKSCYFSRQKLNYARHLAEAIVSKKLTLKKLATLPDEDVRKELTSIKGIGNWTADVYLLFALHRTDVFPTGDLAMMNAFKEIKRLEKNISKDESLRVAEQWKPYRSIATMMLWHFYLEKKKQAR
jgi:DNA-3-methyladenine glycosylase II